MAALKPLDSFTQDTLTLPITAEKSYTFKAVPAAVGLWLQRVTQATVEAQEAEKRGETASLTQADLEQLAPPPMPDGSRPDMVAILLGDARDELLADGISAPAMEFIIATLTVWATAGRDTAIEFWQSEGKPGKVKAPQDRRRKASRSAK